MYYSEDRNEQASSSYIKSSQPKENNRHICASHPPDSISMCHLRAGTGDAEMNKAPASLPKSSQSSQGDPWIQSSKRLIDAKERNWLAD